MSFTPHFRHWHLHQCKKGAGATALTSCPPMAEPLTRCSIRPGRRGQAGLALGPAAIDAELARVKPLIADGGFIPPLDLAIEPELSCDGMLYYREWKRMLIGYG